VTGGFGLPGLLRPHGSGSSGPPGPGPNPFDENVTAVLSSIIYGTGDHSFPSLQGVQLCGQCPAAPTENASYDPPVAGLWFYFNVTNVGSNWTYLANFTLTTSGSNPHLFTLAGVVCCSPTYSEIVLRIGFTPGAHYGFRAYVIASSIPYDGATGYSLYFNATSP